MTDETKMVLPRIMERKVYQGLSPQDKEEYVQRKVLEILEMNPNGVMIPEIDEVTPFTRPTIIKHLEKLVGLRKAYKLRRGRKYFVYYSNGSPIHQEYRIETKGTDGSPSFRGTFINNNFGEYVFLEDLALQSVAGGSILIKRSDMQRFLEFVKDVSDQEKKIKNTDRK